MEIKVQSTGTVSQLPSRLVVSLMISATAKDTTTAQEKEQSKLSKVNSVLAANDVYFRSLSVPCMHEVSHKEEDIDPVNKKKVTRWVKDGYCYYQSGEIYIEGKSPEWIFDFIGMLSAVSECNVSSRFELTESQKDEMSEEAMEKSYKNALRHARSLVKLEMGYKDDDFDSAIKLKEAELLVSDYGAGSSREFRASKMMMQEDFVGSADALYPVQKPLPVSITVDYVFTLLSTFR